MIIIHDLVNKECKSGKKHYIHRQVKRSHWVPEPDIRWRMNLVPGSKNKELNASGALKLVSVCHIGPWTLKMHFGHINLLSGTYRPLNFENAFVALNLLSGTPQTHTCHAGIFADVALLGGKKICTKPLTEVLAVKKDN